jgi:predicted dehydrogenase
MRIGLLGAAWIAPRAILEPARQVSGTDVVAVACRDPSRAQAFAVEYGIPIAYESYTQLVEDDYIDAVFVALVNSLHARWAIAALEAGRHVLCEKPLAANQADSRRMVTAGQQAGRVLMEAFHWRFHPFASRMLELSQRIGSLQGAVAYAHQYVEPPNIRLRYDLAGGVFMDLGCYLVHWLRTLTGEDPQVLSAKATEGPPGVDLTMETELVFPSGLRAVVDCSMVDKEASLPGSVWLHIEGSDGVLDMVNPLVPQAGNRISGRLADGTQIDESVDTGISYAYQLESFVRVVAGIERPVTGGLDAIRNMAAIDAVYIAAGLPVRPSQTAPT